MRSMARITTVAFAAVLCFASCAFAQDTVSTKTNIGSPALLTLTLGYGNQGGSNNNNGGGNGCGNQGGGGGWGWGGDWGWGWGGGGNNGGNCKSVPEGGTTLTYLSLAGLCCLGAVVFRSRRPASLPATNS
ncbi:MAG TPA: hypothetical protein VFF64_11220 [Candidatus Eremiobacteraceae bacterium]|nr:hypothetical protein [Candidatus Eremiobacteraceae bacterium]